MTAGGKHPATPPRRPGGGRGPAVLIGLASFAVVFVLIVGGTVTFLMLRPDPADGGSTTAAAPTRDPGQQSPATAESEDSPAPSAQGEDPTQCWSPTIPSFDSLPTGDTLSGGGLQVQLPEMYQSPGVPVGLPYLDDVQASQAPVGTGWFSTMVIGAVAWHPGEQYPGAEIASQRIVTCLFERDQWGQTQGRTLDDVATTAVTIDGMDGYRTTAVVNFAEDPMERTDASEITVVVLETPQGPGAFVTETSLGVTEHEQAAAQAHESLTAAS